MTLEELLRTAAHDVADQAPGDRVALGEIQSRAHRIRDRRRGAVAALLVAATVLVAVGLQVVRGQKAALEPVEPAPSTPTSSTAPETPIVVVPEFAPEDVRGYEELKTVTNSQGPEAGVTELTIEVPVRDRFAYEWSHFCSGDPDTWYILIVGDGGGSGYGHCSQPRPQPFPTLPTNISPLGHSGDDPTTLTVRMFVTGPIPPQHLACFDRLSPTECQDITPPLQPLASTDVIFGVSVFEHWAPAVAEVAGQDISALASVEGADHVLGQVITAPPGQPGLAATLPSNPRGRLVGVISAATDETRACADAATSLEQERLCTPVLELRIGDRKVTLRREQFGDFPMLGAPYPFFRVPGTLNQDQELELRVDSGDPRNVTFALAVFERTP